jgi:hypothetical protein
MLLYTFYERALELGGALFRLHLLKRTSIYYLYLNPLKGVPAETGALFY